MEEPTGDARAAAVRRRRPPPWAVNPGEGALVAGLRAGDETAFQTLIRRHQAPMLRLARAHVSSHATAEDVVQETWLAVLRGVDRFDGRSSLTTWVYRILVNRAKTAGQREWRCIPDSQFAPHESDGPAPEIAAERLLDELHPQWPQPWKRPAPAGERSVEDQLVTLEAVGVVGDAINHLPPTQRLVVTLRDVECWTAQEVCCVLGLSESNQRVVLHRARGRVRQRLEGYYGSVDKR